MTTYLGLDLGTSGLRGLLVDADQRPVAQAEARYPTARPAPGFAEQSPDDWIDAARQVIAALRADAPGAVDALAGVAVAGHMHGAVLLDDALRPLRPCILWNDTRAAAEAATLDATPGFRETTGNIVFPGFTAPKLAWVARHEPEVFARLRAVVLPKDYLTLWLTGELVSDVSDAAGTAWLDVAARSYSAPLLAATGLGRSRMPRLIEGSAPAGTVRAGLAAELGLPSGVIVAAGAADNAAAACGIGALNEGAGFASLGTSGVVLAARDACTPMPDTAVHTFAHAVPDRWYQMGVTLAATDCLNWLAGITSTSPDKLTGALGETPGAPGRVSFLPYLSGERTPHNDAAIRGGFLGLSVDTTTADLTRAVLEGVAFSLRDCLAALNAAGARLDSAIAVGGGTGSRLWVALLATVLDLPLGLPARGEFGAALGAARLAICAATGADPDAVMTPPPLAETIAPDPARVPAYAEAYAHYKTLYPGIKALTP